jgi:hypothetical protein
MAQATVITMVPTRAGPATGSVSFVSDRQPAASYYVAGKDLQTVAWDLQNTFSADISIQASLATTPGVYDWFTVDMIPTSPSTTIPRQSGYTNLNGKYVWIRVNITNWTAGNINSITLSY